ncbi:hypothetical protein ACJX0J_019119 [Zea mays]
MGSIFFYMWLYYIYKNISTANIFIDFILVASLKAKKRKRDVMFTYENKFCGVPVFMFHQNGIVANKLIYERSLGLLLHEEHMIITYPYMTSIWLDMLILYAYFYHEHSIVIKQILPDHFNSRERSPWMIPDYPTMGICVAVVSYDFLDLEMHDLPMFFGLSLRKGVTKQLNVGKGRRYSGICVAVVGYDFLHFLYWHFLLPNRFNSRERGPWMIPDYPAIWKGIYVAVVGYDFLHLERVLTTHV